MKKQVLTLIIGFWLMISGTAKAQNTYRISDPNYHTWYMYFGDHKFSKRWGLHTEAQFRRADLLDKGQQLLLRTGINYYATERTMLTLGYGYIDTYAYGDYPSLRSFPEHRIYQQLQIGDKQGRLLLQHRFRMEQRFIQYPLNAKELSPDWTYQNRARYMFRATLPLQGATLDSNEFYLSAYDEAFIGFGKNVQGNVFDQNRAYAALGFAVNPNLKIEVGYLNQIVNHRKREAGKDVYEYNHTLQVGLTWNYVRRKR